MIVGVTGHQNLGAFGELVSTMVHKSRVLIGRRSLVSSLAEGADQLVTSMALDAGLDLDVVVPCSDYEATLTEPGRVRYEEYMKSASRVTTLPFPEPTEASFLAAGIVVVERCDVLVAIWDGQPARGLGGTADAVGYARDLGREVVVLWPEGFQRPT